MEDTIDVVDEGNGLVYTFANEDDLYEWDRFKKKTYVSVRKLEVDDLTFNENVI